MDLKKFLRNAELYTDIGCKLCRGKGITTVKLVRTAERKVYQFSKCRCVSRRPRDGRHDGL